MITISDYINSKVRCLKRVWLEKYNVSVLEDKNNDRLDEAKRVKKLGRRFISGGVLINYNSNKDIMIDETKSVINNSNIIYNASFEYDEVFIKCDILEREDDKWNIYLIKNTFEIKEEYRYELAMQYYILQQLGYKLGSTNVVDINKEYTMEDKLDINKLFKITNLEDKVLELVNDVNDDIILIKNVIEENTEPNIELGPYCLKTKIRPACECKKYCFKDIPKNSVFDINGRFLQPPNKFKYYNSGIIEFKDLIKEKGLRDNVRIQVECELNDIKVIKKEEISKFIDKLEYPLYFLDFETFNAAIPPYEGTNPYQQIPFQYSLHYKSKSDSELKHCEYLAKEGVNSTREFAEKLIKDLGKEGSIIVYNKTFESSRIRKLASTYKDLTEDLLKLTDRLVDLMDIFFKRLYYQKEMKGSYSIKEVLPALFPNDEELDYNKLNIKNGSMAMDIFQKLHLKDASEIKQIREDLLKYCNLDTLAMVRILEKLEEEVKI